MATDEARKPSGRGKAVLAIDWWPQSLPDGISITPHTLIAHDGEVSRATLYDRAGGNTVLCPMHPRQDLQRYPAIPGPGRSRAGRAAPCGRRPAESSATI